MPSQFPKIEEIVLPESLQGKLDSEPLEDLLEFEEVHMQHSYLRAVRSTPPGRWDPPLSRREDKEKIEELNDLAEVELRRLYQGLLSAESRGERAEEEKIAMIAGNLPDSLDTYVLKEIITKDPLEVEPPGGDSLLPWRSKEARLFRMYLEGSDRSFEYKKDKIIGIKEKFSSASNRDVAAAAECSCSYPAVNCSTAERT